MIKRFIITVASIALISGPALAQTESVPSERPLTESTATENLANPVVEEKCFPIKSINKLIRKTQTIKASKQDTLELIMQAQFTGKTDAGVFPKFYSKSGPNPDTVIKPFRISPDGKVLNFHNHLMTLNENAELCGEVTTPQGEKPRVGFNLGSDIIFKNRTGPYTLAELQDGVADGKSWYKRMFPGPLSVMVPKMTHLMVQYGAPNMTAEGISFSKSGVSIEPPVIESFGGTFVIALDAIEALGADSMSVEGGAFILSPVPSVEKMKSLGFDSDSDSDF